MYQGVRAKRDRCTHPSPNLDWAEKTHTVHHLKASTIYHRTRMRCRR